MIEQPDQLQELLPLQKTENKRKKMLFIAGAVLLFLVLAGAAFLGGILMHKKNTNINVLISRNQGLSNAGAASAIQANGSPVNFIPAKELPTVQPDVSGIFVKRAGNSITIGTGSLTITMGSGGSESTEPQTSYGGPTYDVVITKDTLIYEETTQIIDPGSSTDSVQQTVFPGSLSDLNSMTNITVWGKKTGDRYVADIVLYTSSLIKMDGGAGGATK